MQLAYQFSRAEIVSKDIGRFNALFSIERLKAAITTEPALAGQLLGSMKIFVELDEAGTQPYEDGEIREFCQILIEQTPALFLASINDRTMSVLFYATFENFTAVAFESAPDGIRFDCDREEAMKHFERLQSKILAVADEVGVNRQDSIEHVGWMAVRLLNPPNK